MADDREDFLRERRERLAESRQGSALSKQFFEETVSQRYSYNFDWLGVPIIQYPQDIVAMQELIWRVKPDLIVETGVARGGSIILYASMMALIGNEGRVLGIDVDIRPHNRESIETHPLCKYITLIEGSSVAATTIEKVERVVSQAKTVVVVLDSSHTYSHVLQELTLYSRFVGAGSYLVVFDTVIEWLPKEIYPDRNWGPGNSPMTAIREFLHGNHRFEIDTEMDAKLLISAAPGGYLRCLCDAKA